MCAGREGPAAASSEVEEEVEAGTHSSNIRYLLQFGKNSAGKQNHLQAPRAKHRHCLQQAGSGNLLGEGSTSSQRKVSHTYRR